MVLRKQPPMGLDYLAQMKDHTGALSSAFPVSPITRPVSPVSPKRLVRRGRARSSPQPYHPPLQSSVYSLDLNTPSAFDPDLIGQAQKPSQEPLPDDSQNQWTDDWVRVPSVSQGHSDTDPLPVPHGGSEEVLQDKRTDNSVLHVVAGTERRIETSEWQHASESNEEPGYEVPRSTRPSQPVRLKSNNPFLKSRQPHPTPWDNTQSQVLDREKENNRDLGRVFALQGDDSDQSSQNEAITPMATRQSPSNHLESESSHTEPHSANGLQHTVTTGLQPTDEDRGPLASPNLTTAKAPTITSLDGTDDHQPGNSQVPAVTPEPPRLTFDNDQSTPVHQDDQTVDGVALGSEDGTNSRSTSASMSNTTAGFSHELTSAEDPADKGAETKNVHDSETIPRSESLADGLPVQNSEDSESSTTAVPQGQGVSKPKISPKLPKVDPKKQKEQRFETYSIRHVSWIDSMNKLRQSPVLVQNQNGPCPLLALVNALVLRAGDDTQPPIVKALQNREQISLGLLIEAMFDELTTCLGPDQQLPDIEELSRFLTMLHTGMNVNPRLTLESDNTVGSFLQTSDLQLYGIFGVPLVHGWVAPPSSRTSESLIRLGQYHEDIQLLHFRKQELEERVIRGGSLSPEEEQVMDDILLVQQFVDVDNATQLSDFGLEQLRKELAPGSVSILFRNDHFSTLYKHPRSHRLFTMVTDAGYSGHAEVVWESQVDVNGSKAGFFSGSFRPVGHSSAEDRSQTRTEELGDNAACSDVPGEPLEPSVSPQEQSDADYAYALQLQFDEEQQQQSQSNRRPSETPQRVAEGRIGPPGWPSVSSDSVPLGRLGPLADAYVPNTGSTVRTSDGPDGPPPPYSRSADNVPVREPLVRAQTARERPVRETSQFTSFSQDDRYLRNPYDRRPGAPITAVPDRFRERTRDCVVM